MLAQTCDGVLPGSGAQRRVDLAGLLGKEGIAPVTIALPTGTDLDLGSQPCLQWLLAKLLDRARQPKNPYELRIDHGFLLGTD